MNWPRPRFTIRRAMVGVVVVAVGLGLALPAVEVCRDSGFHVHAWIDPEGRPKPATGGPIHLAATSPTILRAEMRSAPFWPRYRRCLLGRPWRDQPLCTAEPSRIAETCEYQHPDLVDRQLDGSFFLRWTPQILTEGRRQHPDLFPANSTQPSSLAGP